MDSQPYQKLYGSEGLHALSLHPGIIATELLRHIPDDQKEGWAKNESLQKYWKSPEQGAATTVWAAVARGLEGVGGKYLDDCQVASEADPTKSYAPGYTSWAYDPEDEAKQVSGGRTEESGPGGWPRTIFQIHRLSGLRDRPSHRRSR